MERGVITNSGRGRFHIPSTEIWMTQDEISDLLMVFGCDVRKAIRSIYKEDSLIESESRRHFQEGNYGYDAYSLETVIAVAFRIRSIDSLEFRKFVMERLVLFSTPMGVIVNKKAGYV